MQTSNHHPRSRPAKDREQSEILQIHKRECEEVHRCVQLVEGKVTAERAKQSQKGPIGEPQAGKSIQAARRRSSIEATGYIPLRSGNGVR